MEIDRVKIRTSYPPWRRAWRGNPGTRPLYSTRPAMADSPLSNPLPTCLRVSMATVLRTAEHRVCTSSIKSPAPSTGRPSDCGFPLAAGRECPRSDRPLDLHNRHPGFALPSYPVPMREVSSRPDTAAGGARFPGSLRDMTGTAGHHDPRRRNPQYSSTATTS